MKTYEVTLDDESAALVDRMLEDGPWENLDELFANSLGSLQEDILLEPDLGMDIDEVKQKLQVGLDQIDRGEVVDGEEVFARLFARLDAARLQPTS